MYNDYDEAAGVPYTDDEDNLEEFVDEKDWLDPDDWDDDTSWSEWNESY